ncbi:MAG: DUF362 domain-containing protein [Planctomycetota bacterium]|nr:MAG: DUF362 domain-containing protein [Planctomycetota bacterium]
MKLPGKTDIKPVRRKRGRSFNTRRQKVLVWLFPIAGLLSLIWFLIRVVPKPSRATYPCQRVTAPLAGGFLFWLGGIVGSCIAFRKAGIFLRQAKRPLTLICLGLAISMAVIAVINSPNLPVRAEAPIPLTPIGTARGVNPGRVVWVHDPAATDWAGPGDGHWWESTHTDQTVVDSMISQTIRALSGEPTDVAAWDALIRHFNLTHGKGDVAYTPGEKICIKVNFVGCIANGGTVDPNSYDLIGRLDYMNTSPQMMLALLRQLIYVVGVNPADISIGDPTCLFPNQYYNPLHDEFPDVHYLDRNGGNVSNPRTPVDLSSVPFYWSVQPSGKTQDYVPLAYAEAAYLFIIANLKAHTAAGVTLCAKNHFGSLKRYPPAGSYYNMHETLPSSVPQSGRYRCLVDLMGHAQTGGKTLMYLIDGLYSGIHPIDSSPRKWSSAPFDDDWTSSLFASQDPVAIDSVAFDFLYEEWTSYPHMSGTDDYLHEAAQADSPPSGTFYDPDHPTNTTPLDSLGTHEHWNNATDKQYSRNLGTGDGIELIPVGPPVAVIQANPTEGLAPLTVDFDATGSFDPDGTIVSYAWDFDGDDIIDDNSGPVTNHTYTNCDTYLAKLTVTDNEDLTSTDSVQVVVLPYPGDFDEDKDVDQEDFGHLQACLGSSPPPAHDCFYADLNGDSSVNRNDVTIFIGCMSGANNPADPNCAD